METRRSGRGYGESHRRRIGPSPDRYHRAAGDRRTFMRATSIAVIVVAVVNSHAGTGTDPYPIGARDVSLDSGLREEIEEQIEAPLADVAALDLFGIRLTNLPVVPPPPTRSPLFPEDWAWVRADLLAAMDPVHGGAVQAIVTDLPLDASTVQRLGLTRLG